MHPCPVLAPDPPSVLTILILSLQHLSLSIAERYYCTLLSLPLFVSASCTLMFFCGFVHGEAPGITKQAFCQNSWSSYTTGWFVPKL